MKNNTIFIFAFIFASLLIASLVIADSDENKTGKKDFQNNSLNMTYGQCVSEQAKLKNTCYSSIKNVSLECKSAAQNSSVEMKKCNNEYKKSKAGCKKIFKDSKKEICGKIKHNFFETIGSAFK